MANFYHECKICSQTIAARVFQGHLLNNHGLNSEQYYMQHVNPGHKAECKNCKKPMPFINISTGYKTCCSKGCAAQYGHALHPENRYSAVESLKKYNSDPAHQSRAGKIGYQKQQELYPDIHSKIGKAAQEKHKDLYRECGKIMGTKNRTAFNTFRKQHEGCGPYEWMLWSDSRFKALRPRRQNYDYRKTNKIIMDFSIDSHGICIEIDGHSHTPEYDNRRDEELKSMGWKVLHFSNDDIESDLDSVISKIYSAVGRTL